MANAGIDRSNVGAAGADERVLLLPHDPDASAAALRAALAQRTGVACGVIISDSFGRAWRKGVVNVALGAAGVTALWTGAARPTAPGGRWRSPRSRSRMRSPPRRDWSWARRPRACRRCYPRLSAACAAANPARTLIRPLDEDLFR